MSRDDDIRTRAHQIWEQEGKPEGAHDEHWHRAREEFDLHGPNGEQGGMLGGQANTEPPGNAPAVAQDGALSSIAAEDAPPAGRAKAAGAKP